MNELVEACRSEWKRLGVPDSIAAEMAAELADDLEEAEADGVSAEEVLGSGAFDPRSFAATWATERGVIQRRPPAGPGLTRGSRRAAAIGTFALVIAIVGAVLVIVDSRAAPETRAFGAPGDMPRVWLLRDEAPRPPVLSVTVDGDPVRLALPVPPSAGVAGDTNDSGIDSRTVGSILLIVGLAGLVPSALFLLWLGPGRGRVHTTTTV